MFRLVLITEFTADTEKRYHAKHDSVLYFFRQPNKVFRNLNVIGGTLPEIRK